MAATSYSTLPSNTNVGLGSQGDPYRSNNYGTYDSGIGSLASHPYQYQTDTYETNHHDYQQQPHYSNEDYSAQQVFSNEYAQPSTYDQHLPLNGYSNSEIPKTNDRPIAMNNTGNYATKNATQPPHKKNIDNQYAESRNHQQTFYADSPRHHAPVDDQQHQSQSNLVRSEQQISNYPHKQQKHKSQPPPQKNPTRSEHQISKHHLSPPVRQRSPSNVIKNHASETAPKTNNPPLELKPTKSSIMRAAANKKKEENREQKQKDSYFPVSQNKATPTKLKPPQQESPQTDVDRSDSEKVKRNKKQSRSLSKSNKNRQTDGEQSEPEKTKGNKKQSQLQDKQRKSRPDDYHAENNNSSGDDHDNKRHRSKSKKRTTFSDSHIEKHTHLPPLRHGRMPPYYDPALNYPHPLPHGHPLRGRFPYHDDYPPYGPYPYSDPYDHRHLYGDDDHIPPYLAPYHDPYDAFFDYEKRKAKPKLHRDDNHPHTDHDDNGGVTGNETERDDGAKSQQSRKTKNRSVNNNTVGRRSRRNNEEYPRPYWPHGQYSPYYSNPRDMLEMWRQERNDYLKKKFKPTIHDVLYSQQWMKADGYLENQRRRALRDTQGYYFPYKKYTLKDYKDLPKYNNQNPFAEDNETTIDRKERMRKRQEYGTQIERQITENPPLRHMQPHEMLSRKPWHLSNGELHDAEKSSKRERALEYAKVQVKYRLINPEKDHSDRSDRTEQNENNFHRQTNDDGDRSINEKTSKTNQLFADYDE